MDRCLRFRRMSLYLILFSNFTHVRLGRPLVFGIGGAPWVSPGHTSAFLFSNKITWGFWGGPGGPSDAVAPGLFGANLYL